jgi:predicted dehydrogenase
LHAGLRFIRRGTDKPEQVPFTKNDTFVDELDEFAAAVRGHGIPETGGEYATRSLGVIRAGIISAREGRRVQLAEVLSDPKA